MVDWTAHEDDVLKAMVKEGNSFSVIGQRLGRSKGAVSGRALRIGLGERKVKSYAKRKNDNPRRSKCTTCGQDCRSVFSMCRVCYDKLLRTSPLFCESSKWIDDNLGRLRYHGDLSVVKELISR